MSNTKLQSHSAPIAQKLKTKKKKCSTKAKSTSIIGNNNHRILELNSHLISCSFEVFGHVQGVSFRKHTQQQARQFGLRGWCSNTDRGTVRGVLQGPVVQVIDMQNWLKTRGSPKSQVERVEFSLGQIKEYSLFDFAIRLDSHAD